MSKRNTRGIAAAGVAAALLIPTISLAQTKVEEVVVTGSRIARPNLESAVPITTVSGDEFFQTGNTAIGDLLNNLPSIRSTYSQSNSSRFLGTAGLNLLDLRGLGTQRTLVLVNGRRHVGSDILNNAVSPDTNTIPSDLIDRIDVVTGGNSAVYGSDAIAGVVNFVLKRNFEGLQVRGQGGMATEGDGGDYYASALWGTNFNEGRGNVAVNLEYAKQERVFASDRDNLAKNHLFVVTDTDTTTSLDATPDRLYYNDIKFATLSNGGNVLWSPAAASALAPCGRDGLRDATFPNGRPYGCSFLFQTDGSLVPQTGTRIGLAPNGNYDGGNGSNNREGKLLGIFPDLDRVSLNVIGHYTVSEAFEPYVEAKYVRTESLSFSGPAFFQGGTIDGNRERPRFDNPYLTDQARTVINQGRVASGLTALAGSTRFSIGRNLADLGPRQEEATRETTRFVLGATGSISDDWSYDVSVNWGEFKEDTEVLGNLNVQRFALAMDAGRDGTGTIRCRSQFDPADAYSVAEDGVVLSDEDIAFAEARLAGDIAACVPINPFGEGNISQAARNYVLSNTTSVGKIEQFVASASISGNSSKWFELPAGPLGIAFGAEHRTEENFFKSDELVSHGLTFYNALPLFDPPKFKVDEAFLELRVPILRDLPIAQEVTFSGAGRYADYNGATGEVFAHNFGLEYAPIEDIRFRVGKARAIRAPNLSDLYSALTQNFTNPFNDPCSARNIGTGSATRAANCTAAGIPTSFDYVYVQSLELRSGGNPDLVEETSDSFTAGVVLRPRFLPAFSLSVDYFDIDIDNVITAPTPQAIVNACYDSASLTNQFCALFQRNPSNAAADPFRIVEGSLQQVTLNYASRTARGIDVEAAYSQTFDLGRLTTRLVWGHALQRDDFLDPTNPGRADQILYELGDPKDAANLNVDFTAGKLSFGYEARYVGRMVLNLYEDTYSKQGRPPQNADYATRRYYPQVVYHDVRAAYDVGNALNVYVGIDNVADKDPPLGVTGAGAGSAIYESKGRFIYAGAKYNFGASK